MVNFFTSSVFRSKTFKRRCLGVQSQAPLCTTPNVFQRYSTNILPNSIFVGAQTSPEDQILQSIYFNPPISNWVYLVIYQSNKRYLPSLLDRPCFLHGLVEPSTGVKLKRVMQTDSRVKRCIQKCHSIDHFSLYLSEACFKQYFLIFVCK